MNDLPTRHHQLKVLLATIALVIFGAALIVVEETAAEWTGIAGSVPWSELGGILVGAGVLSVWLDYLLRQDQQRANEQRLRQILSDHAPLMRDAVLEAFAANHADLKRVATPATLDRIAEGALALRMDDADLAQEVYGDLRTQVVDAGERWHDAQVSIDLRPLGTKGVEREYLDVTVRWEYTTIPRHHQRRFVSLSDRQEYATLAQSGGDASPWFFKPDEHFAASDRKAYELLQFAVNGHERSIKRSTRKDYQAYTVDIDRDIAEDGVPATVSYTFRTATRRDGHLLFFDIEQPTQRLALTVDYTDAGFEGLTAIDLVPAGAGSTIEASPADALPKQLRVDVRGWSYPRAGVVLVWSERRR